MTDILAMMTARKAIVTESHVVYTSGRHGSAYVNKDAIYPFPEDVSWVCELLANSFIEEEPEAVVGPAMGGIILSQWTAYHLRCGSTLALYAEKTERSVMKAMEDFAIAALRMDLNAVHKTAHGFIESMLKGEELVIKSSSFALRRGYDKLIFGKRVLVVEDVITTGGSVKKVVDAVRVCGGEVIGIAALCNRGGITAEVLDVPRLQSLFEVPLESFPEDTCPLCKAGVPINTDVGKGRDFLARQK